MSGKKIKRPIVLVVTRSTDRKGKIIDYVGELHLGLLIRLGLLPILVPVVAGTPACIPDYAKNMSGLLLVEGEDVDPKYYKATAANIKFLEKTHAVKDEVEIKLLRLALRQKLPVFGICRGAQVLNVVSGGTLFGDVQKEKKSRLNHIDFSNYDGYRHSIAIVPDSPLHRWYKRDSLMVNSYHHQGVRDLAPSFRPMAHADDGLIEGFYDPRKDFVVGLQFHPERMSEEAEGNWRVWKAFGDAVRAAAAHA